jgi:CDP-6-deoxy-D-xylo-4-hexulose-3-dehydrase
MGSEVKKFEKLMCEYLKVKHFVMVNSGSSANLLMFEALLRPTKSKPRLHLGDGILVPAIAWPTTIWPIIQLGLVPIFVDIDPKTLAIDLIKAQDLIDSTKIPVAGIFPIHPLGFAIPPSHLKKFIEKNNLLLINDTCESLGSWNEDLHAGTFGTAGSFSFYFSHHITTMEGGGIATDDDEYADDLRSMRSHGWSRDRSDALEWNKKALNNNVRIEDGIKQVEFDFPIKLYIRFQDKAQLNDLEILNIEEEYKSASTNYIIANVNFNSLFNIYNKRDNKLFICAI